MYTPCCYYCVNEKAPELVRKICCSIIAQKVQEGSEILSALFTLAQCSNEKQRPIKRGETGAYKFALSID